MRRIASAVISAVLVIAGLFASASLAPGAKPPVTVVRPTGVFPADVENVQAAVDGGGAVLLSAKDADGRPRAFNFGPAAPSAQGGRGVTVTRDVVVTGERSGKAVSTITGGNIPFFGGFGASVTIADLSFVGPFSRAILLIDAPSATIARNRVEHVVGRLRGGATFANAIETALGGTTTIKDNVVDDVIAAAGIGIEQFGATERVVISGNRVSGTNLIAIEATNDVSTRIVGNTVAPGPQRFPRFAAGTGIEANSAGPFEIKDNSATCENPIAICVFVFGETGFFGFLPVVAPVVKDNEVELRANGSVGVALIGEVSHGVIADNEIEGIGDIAFALFGCGCGDQDDLFANTFRDNEVEDFTSSVADVYFEPPAHDNVVKESCRTFVDLGTANQISCNDDSDDSKASSLSFATQSARSVPLYIERDQLSRP